MPSTVPVEILGVRVDDVDWERLTQAIVEFVREGGAHRIATVNTEYMMAARHNPEFAETLRHTALNVPDSVGILAAARWLGHPLRERVTGSDGILRISELCAEHGFRLYLYGAQPGIAEQAAHILIERYPELIVCGTQAGPHDASRVDGPENAQIVARIAQARPDVLLIAYPQVPQEMWLSHNLSHTGAAVGMGVGAAFDFVAGAQQRAPRWMQQLGLEWFYRLLKEPWRWRRMLVLPQAAWLVFWQKWQRASSRGQRRES